MKSDPQSPVAVVFWITGHQHAAQWFADRILQVSQRQLFSFLLQQQQGQQ